MGLVLPRSAAEVLDFFEANDAHLGLLLENLSTSQREAILADLDIVLAAVDRETFEDHLRRVVQRHGEAPAGTGERARFDALVRILGIEYQRLYGGDLDDLSSDPATGGYAART